jgi:hypothetical protein
MIETHTSVLIERPVAEVYRYVAEEFFTNYPKWSPEVTRLEQTTTGPMRVGTAGLQVRCDAGYTAESRFRVTALVPLRELRFESLGKPHFCVQYRFEAIGNATRLGFRFELKPTLLLTPLRGLIRRTVTDGGQRVVANLKSLLESDSATAKRS